IKGSVSLWSANRTDSSCGELAFTWIARETHTHRGKLSSLPRLFSSFRGRFFADFFFDSAPPFAGQPGPEKSVEQIGKKKHSRHPFVIHHREDHDQTDNKKPRDRLFCFPVDPLEARIFEPAEHHKGEKKQEGGQNEFPVAEVMFAFGEPEQKKCDRRDKTGRGGNRKTGERILVIGSVMPSGRRIETSQTQCTTRDINKSDNPAGPRELLKDDAVDHQRRCETKRNNVG